jgi:nicotinate phosphoribosyltransferase
MRLAKKTGTITEELVFPAGRPPANIEGRLLMEPLVHGGETVGGSDLAAARALVAVGLTSLPWEGLKLSDGDPAIPTRIVTQ